MSKDPSEYVFKHMWEEEPGKEYRNIRHKQKIATCHVHLHRLCIGNRFFSHHQAGYLSLPSPSIHLCLHVPRQQRERGETGTPSRRSCTEQSFSFRKEGCTEKTEIIPSAFLSIQVLVSQFQVVEAASEFWVSKTDPRLLSLKVLTDCCWVFLFF